MKIWKTIIVINATVTTLSLFCFFLIQSKSLIERSPDERGDSSLEGRVEGLEKSIESLVENSERDAKIEEHISSLEQSIEAESVAAKTTVRPEEGSSDGVASTDSGAPLMAAKSRVSLEQHFGGQPPEDDEGPEILLSDPTFGELASGTKRSFAGITMVWCAPGRFQMGEKSQVNWQRDEIGHIVLLTRGFWIGEAELTIDQWEDEATTDAMSESSSFFGATGSSSSSGSQLVELTEGQLPQAGIAWNDCNEWLRKMNQAHPLPDGWKWDLPTEAQWEYACRSGTNGLYAGDPGKLATYNRSEASHVKQKEPNLWGIYDMHGNVSEWCKDLYDQFYGHGMELNFETTNPKPFVNPTGPSSGSFFVARGGNFDDDRNKVRSAVRGGYDEWTRSHQLGFRPAINTTE